MSERKKIAAKELRKVLMALGEGGKEISNSLIYQALGLELDTEKDTIRARMTDMVRHGEMTRTARGTFIYNFNRSPRKSAGYEAIWRFVRAAKPGWSIEDCSLMTRMSYTHCLRYINWLEEEGFVARDGRNEKNGIIYRNTARARITPETPYPAIKESDPFAKERVAAATITRLMLCSNPYSLKTGRLITEACHTLLARFEKNTAENRMENENEEESHVE